MAVGCDHFPTPSTHAPQHAARARGAVVTRRFTSFHITHGSRAGTVHVCHAVAVANLTPLSPYTGIRASTGDA